MAATAAEFTAIPGTREATGTISRVGSRCRPRISRDIQLVATPAFTSVFDSRVGVHVAVGQTLLDRHGGAVVFDNGGEKTALAGFADAGVVCEVHVAVGRDGWAGVNGRLGRRSG